LDEIRSHLASQWSQLFQRLLFEGRTKTKEVQRYRDFSEQIEDLKAVVLASVTTPDLRKTAKGAIQFRRLIGFVSALHFVDHRQLLLSKYSWHEMLKQAKIAEIQPITPMVSDGRMNRQGAFLILEDGTFYRSLYPLRALDEFSIDWNNFVELESHTREAIVAALLEDRDVHRIAMVRYIDKNFNEFLAERNADIQADNGEDLV
jgi:hypothetical protein